MSILRLIVEWDWVGWWSSAVRAAPEPALASSVPKSNTSFLRKEQALLEPLPPELPDHRGARAREQRLGSHGRCGQDICDYHERSVLWNRHWGCGEQCNRASCRRGAARVGRGKRKGRRQRAGETEGEGLGSPTRW